MDPSSDKTADAGQPHTNYVLTFTYQQWLRFWQLLMLGSAMSDYLLYPQDNGQPPDLGKTTTAQKWNHISTELASTLSDYTISSK